MVATSETDWLEMTSVDPLVTVAVETTSESDDAPNLTDNGIPVVLDLK